MRNWVFKNKNYLIIFFLSIIVAIVFFNRYFETEITGDAIRYWNHSEQIALKPSHIFNSPEFGHLEPIHNIIFGFIRMLPGNDRINLGIIQAILFGTILLLLYKFTLNFGNSLFAFFVVFWTFTCYRFYEYVWNPNRDIWVFYFVTTLFYFAYQYNKKKDLKNLVWFSIVSGIVLLTDMRYMAHIGLLMLLFLFIPKIRFFNKIKRTFLIVVLIGAIIFPWIYRQYKVFDEWMFISKFRSELFTKVFNKKDYSNTIHHWAEQRGEQKSREQLLEQIENGTLDKSVYDRIMKKDNYYNKHKLIGRIAKAGAFWKFCSFDYFMMPLVNKKSIRVPWSLQHNLDGILHIGILIPFFIIGVFFSFKTKNYFFIMLVIMLIGHTFLHVFTYVQERYRLIIIPYYFIIGFYGLFNIIHLFQNKFINKR